MMDNHGPTDDYVLVLRGYGRILLSLGFVAVGIGVFMASVANFGHDLQKGWAWIIGGGIALATGAFLLRGAR